MPEDGDDLTIACSWTILMDMNPERIGNFIIDGDVTVANNVTEDINITADFIYIRRGSLTAGSLAAPFPRNLTIQINGNSSSPNY
jgi:hypothetical protein